MENNVMISVIVPVYNVEAYLARCLDSILTQTYSNLEIILVDDGTKDSSGVICDEYAAKDSRIRVIHKENGGLSSARNVGIDLAQGEYIAFVDSDDWLEPDAYRQLLELARKYDVKLVCGGRYDVQCETGEKTLGLCPPREEVITAEALLKRIFTWDNIDSAAWDKLYHRSLFEQIRYPLGKIVEDVPTTYRIALRAERAAMCNQPVYNYFHRPNSITTASKVTEKTFHFSQHTATIYPFIRDNYPQIQDEARYLRVRSLLHSLFSIELAEEDTRRQFAEVCRSERKALREHMGFIFRSHLFSQKERITNLLLATGLYRWLRPLYHAVK